MDCKIQIGDKVRFKKKMLDSGNPPDTIWINEQRYIWTKWETGVVINIDEQGVYTINTGYSKEQVAINEETMIEKAEWKSRDLCRLKNEFIIDNPQISQDTYRGKLLFISRIIEKDAALVRREDHSDRGIVVPLYSLDYIIERKTNEIHLRDAVRLSPQLPYIYLSQFMTAMENYDFLEWAWYVLNIEDGHAKLHLDIQNTVCAIQIIVPLKYLIPIK